MDPISALIAFLGVSTVVAAVFLAPRLGDAMSPVAPVSPAAVLAALDALDDPELAGDPAMDELRSLLQTKPARVRADLHHWRERCRGWGAAGARLESALAQI